jgi:hypothetical protein
LANGTATLKARKKPPGIGFLPSPRIQISINAECPRSLPKVSTPKKAGNSS